MRRSYDLRKRGLTIENQQRRVSRSDGSYYVVSEYRYVAPRGQMELSL